MGTGTERFTSQILEFVEPALGDGPRMTVAVIVLDGNGNPRRALVRQFPIALKHATAAAEMEVGQAVCQELRSIADDPAALRAFVDSLSEANWSIRLSEPVTLSATTLDAAMSEVSGEVLGPL